MNIKILQSVCLIASMSLLLVACGGSSDETSTAAVDITTTAQVEPEPADPPTEDEKFPAKVEKKYLDTCLGGSGGNDAMCNCMLEAFESTVSLAEFEELDDASSDAQASEETTAAVTYCIRSNS